MKISQKLRKELLKRGAIDKKVRTAPKLKVKQIISIDKKNTAWMKKVIKKYGWPTISLVGKKGAEKAWILVQHADLDVRFQKKCLKLMKQAAKKREAELKRLAYLIDRVNVNEKKPQLYGTQFYENKKGVYGPRPIRDRKNLDKRRRKVGLEPFSKYNKGILKYYKKWNTKK